MQCLHWIPHHCDYAAAVHTRTQKFIHTDMPACVVAQTDVKLNEQCVSMNALTSVLTSKQEDERTPLLSRLQ